MAQRGDTGENPEGDSLGQVPLVLSRVPLSIVNEPERGPLLLLTNELVVPET